MRIAAFAQVWNWHFFPLGIAKRPASGYGITFTAPEALEKQSKLTPNLAVLNPASWARLQSEVRLQ